MARTPHPPDVAAVQTAAEAAERASIKLREAVAAFAEAIVQAYAPDLTDPHWVGLAREALYDVLMQIPSGNPQPTSGRKRKRRRR